MTDERLSYRFGPLERRGLLGPLRFGQVATIGGALAVGVELLDRIGGGAGVMAAVALLAGAVGLATAPVAGRTIEEWTPVGCAFAVRSARGRRRFRSRLPTQGVGSRGYGAKLEPPENLRGVELVSVAHGGRTLGALSERRGRLLTPVLACQALSFALLDPEVQERRLAAWGNVLATAANAPVRRLQWIERTTPAQGDELARWLHEARDPALPARGASVVESYLELIGQSTQVTHDHEILLAIQLDTARMHGRSALASEQVIEQVGQVVRGLESAEIRVLGALSTGQLARVLRTGFDPYARAELTALDPASDGGRMLQEHAAGPMAAAEAWDHYRCDGALHATHWISSWPRIDVSPMFMDALLADSGAVRTVAVTFEPVSPERSAREVEAAITRDRADSELRRRFGQSETARQRQAQEAAARREAELAAGHGEVRFSGFVTVSGRDEGELRRACAEVHRHAARARLELRRLYGQQAEAFSFTLPLARGASVSASRTGHRVTTRHAQAIYPFTAGGGLGGRGAFIGREAHGGAFCFDPWVLYDEGALDDPNAIVIGKLGQGKSALVKTLLWRMLLFGRRAFVLDVKREYGPLCAGVGVKPVSLSPGGGVRLNPLSARPEEHAQIELLRAITTTAIGEALDQVEAAVLRESLRTVRDHTPEPTLPQITAIMFDPPAELAARLQTTPAQLSADCRRAALALQDLCEGPLKGIFDGPTSPGLDLDARLLVLDLHAVRDSPAVGILMACATAWMSAQLARTAEQPGRGRLINVADESWKIIQHGGLGEWFQSNFKLARQFGVLNLVVLHKLGDLQAAGDAGSRSARIAEGLIADASTRIIYHQDESQIGLTRDLLGLSATEARLLTQLTPGQALWRVGSRSFVVQHYRSRIEQRLTDTDTGMRLDAR